MTNREGIVEGMITMNNPPPSRRLGFYCRFLLYSSILLPLAGCGPSYRDNWRDAQEALVRSNYGPARYFLAECNRRKPRQVEVLHDLGVCSVFIAREKFSRTNHPAAMRELDRAIGYFSSAIDEHPGHFASMEGLNVALELKGQFDEALGRAEWAAEFVGPSARQYVFLARELEERGDQDDALLRYRQAVAMEPDNATAHAAFAKFLLRVPNEAAAVHHLLAAYKIDPNDPWVLEELSAQEALPPPLSRPGSSP